MNMFIDTTNSCLILILEKDNKIIDSLVIKNLSKVSDDAVENISNLLTKNNLQVKDVKKFYITLGPGTYTGVRVGVSVVKTFKTINDNFEIYTISSLNYQAGISKTISLLDARGDKFYLGIYDAGKSIIEDQIIDKDYIEDFKEQFNQFEIKKNYEDFNYLQNFLNLKSYFKKVFDLNDLNPIYIKSFL